MCIWSLVCPPSGTATLRINGDRLNFGKYVLVSGVSAGAEERLTVDPNSAAIAGRTYSVVEKNGDHVLNVKGGLVLIFK